MSSIFDNADLRSGQFRDLSNVLQVNGDNFKPRFYTEALPSIRDYVVLDRYCLDVDDPGVSFHR